ncbi:MAG: LysR family transcriptional regulator [Eubacteriales bacterium]|nr:LysR family transcriptional regulator [Eubacteriales bacterium]
MNIKDLEYFKSICEKKSITRAAHSLYMTPQGLSKIVKNLETELGTVLLNRTGSGITLTEPGHYLYDHLDEFLGTYEKICREIRIMEQKQSHEVNLLSAYGILRLVTPECLAAFQEQHPEIKLSYREFPDRQMEQHFLEGEGNVAFSVGNAIGKHVIATPMEKYPLKLLVNRKHPLAQKSVVRFEELRNEPFYLENSDFHLHEMIVNRCKEEGFTPNIAFETSGFSLCHSMVARNKGISVSLDFMFDDMHTENMVLIPFEGEPMYWQTYMLMRKGEPANSDVALFHKHVLNWMQKIQNGEILR